MAGSLLFSFFGGSSPKTTRQTTSRPGSAVTASQTQSSSTPQQPPPAILAKLRSALDDLSDRFARERDDADKIIDLQIEVSNFRRVSGLPPVISQEVDTLAQQVRTQSQALGGRILEGAIEKTQRLIADKSFAEAFEVLKVPPRIVEENGLSAKWFEQKKLVEGYTHEARKWGYLVNRVRKYLGQSDKDIAIAILEENVTKKYEDDFPVIWDEKEKLLQDIRLEEAERIRVASEVERKEREARIALLRAKLEKERLEKWNNLFVLTEWVSLLSVGGDLENWFMTVDRSIEFDADLFPWKNTRVGDEQILSADISDRESNIFIGMNGNRWLDWALEFDVQVLAGSLELEPRVWTQAGGGGAQFVSGSTKNIVFDSSKYGSWTSVRLEVHARTAQAIVEGEVTDELRTKFGRGGFRFVLQPEGVCQIKNLRIKWVSTLAPGEPAPVDELSELEDDEDDDY